MSGIFLGMFTVAICAGICLRIYCTLFPSYQLNKLSDVDTKRIKAKNLGYVLHKEAYNNGIEMYVPKCDENLALNLFGAGDVKRSWVIRI